MTHPVHSLLDQLLRQPSITPNDHGCMELITQQLADSGALCQRIDINDTANLWVSHGHAAPVIVFVGHTDVVPPGDLAQWQSNPFVPEVRDGLLYARGAADMKSGVAAMTCAFAELLEKHPDHPGTLALLLTSDEEGDADDGIQAVLPRLRDQGIHINYAIVGEPTAAQTLGDTARNGRRGSLNLTLTLHGQQGHVAYPEQIHNPIHGLGEVIAQLSAVLWDQGNAHFPPTSCQFSNIAAGTGAENVVPGAASAKVNWRFNTEHTAQSIQQRAEEIIHHICAARTLRAEYQWKCSGEPFSTSNPLLMNALRKAVARHTGQKIEFNTAGGTSDARFMAKYGADTIEFGPVNATIHKVNECVKLNDLEPMVAIYRDTVIHLWQEK